MHKVFCFLWFLGLCPAYAEGIAEDVQKIQEEKATLIREYKRLLSEIASLKEDLQTLSQEYEEKRQRMALKKKEISEQLLLLTRLGRTNPLRVLVDSSTPQNTFRGISLLRTLTTSLKHQHQGLRAELNEIEALSETIKSKSQAQAHLLEEIDLQHASLSSLERKKIEEYVQGELERLSKIEDVNTLLDETRETLSQAKSKSAPPPLAGGRSLRWLERPVAGKIIQNQALQKKFSPHSKGLIFETEKNAEVFAAGGGKIVFKGPFKKKENIILIVDHGNKVYSIYMGMNKIDAELGQKVYAGERLGKMAGYGEISPKLYFELRQEGKPLDPQPYFAD